MPIDPYHLDADRRRPRTDPGDGLPSRRTGWIVFVIGASVLAVPVLIAAEYAELRPLLAKGMMGLLALSILVGAVHTGTREGLIGFLFSWHHPMSSLDPDSRPRSPVVIALLWLLGLGVIASLVLVMTAPEKGT